MKGNKKGFTLIELLAVIIVLALILVFAIPAVLNTSEKAQKKTFATYARKVLTLGQEFIEAEKLDSNITKKAIYNHATKGFSLGTNDNDYYACVVYDSSEEGNEKYKIYMFNGSFYVDGKKDSELKTTAFVEAIDSDHQQITFNETDNTCTIGR